MLALFLVVVKLGQWICMGSFLGFLKIHYLYPLFVNLDHHNGWSFDFCDTVRAWDGTKIPYYLKTKVLKESIIYFLRQTTISIVLDCHYVTKTKSLQNFELKNVPFFCHGNFPSKIDARLAFELGPFSNSTSRSLRSSLSMQVFCHSSFLLSLILCFDVSENNKNGCVDNIQAYDIGLFHKYLSN